jgi:tubulin--tyrosine ligase
MRKYYTEHGLDYSDFMPITYHIEQGVHDNAYEELVRRNYSSGVWIVKPGESTNRGNGITVCLGVGAVEEIIQQGLRHSDGKLITYIV